MTLFEIDDGCAALWCKVIEMAANDIIDGIKHLDKFRAGMVRDRYKKYFGSTDLARSFDFVFMDEYECAGGIPVGEIFDACEILSGDLRKHVIARAERELTTLGALTIFRDAVSRAEVENKKGGK